MIRERHAMYWSRFLHGAMYSSREGNDDVDELGNTN